MLIYMMMIDSESDQSKFEQIYMKYKGLMFYVANDILHNEHDAEDAVHQAFIKIAENRTNKIITTLKLLGNCSNKSNYDYTDEEVKKIFSAIEQELRNTKMKFAEANSKKKEFSLRG